jgi:predicted ATPase
MILKSVTFNQNIKFDLNRPTSKFSVKEKTISVADYSKPIVDNRFGSGRIRRSYTREDGYEKKKIKIKEFCLFKKGFSLDFQDPITVIVGDNGTGKSTLLKFLNFRYQKPLFVENEQEHFKKKWTEYKDDENRKLEFVSNPKMIILENNIHKNGLQSYFENQLNPFRNFNRKDVANFVNVQDFSNGESVLDILSAFETLEDSLIILDEPETSLSIKSQVLVKGMLSKIAKKNQLIIATHSPKLMELSESIYCIETKKYVERTEYLKQFN